MTSHPRRRQSCYHRQGELKSRSIQNYLFFLLLFVFSGLVTGHFSDIEAICEQCCLSSLQSFNTQSHNNVAPWHRLQATGQRECINPQLIRVGCVSLCSCTAYFKANPKEDNILSMLHFIFVEVFRTI